MIAVYHIGPYIIVYFDDRSCVVPRHLRCLIYKCCIPIQWLTISPTKNPRFAFSYLWCRLLKMRILMISTTLQSVIMAKEHPSNIVRWVFDFPINNFIKSAGISQPWRHGHDHQGDPGHVYAGLSHQLRWKCNSGCRHRSCRMGTGRAQGATDVNQCLA